MTLTREQLIEVLPRITGATPNDAVLRMRVLDHDAALRARIQTLEEAVQISGHIQEENTALRARVEEVEMEIKRLDLRGK